MSRKPFTLVRADVSHDTIKALEFLLHEARRGEVIGIAYGAMMRRRACIIDTAGEAHRNPLFALGVVHSLAVEIADRARNDEN